MRRRLTAPTFRVFILSLVLAALAVASLYTNIPVIGHYINSHRFWVMTAAFVVLTIGVVFDGL
jgi:hypothetical protein